jgi:hypothetical protein
MVRADNNTIKDSHLFTTTGRRVKLIASTARGVQQKSRVNRTNKMNSGPNNNETGLLFE